ncbi:ABC transporter permease [Microlunatus endophyticus]|uniref:ABC transporter permease n=2 Tax=Microlunatus endophyticus TaxID=1716077 RepID=A0A917S019_9ACTN|nr:ABC transporter permease [Microlunatus endophyticus]
MQQALKHGLRVGRAVVAMALIREAQFRAQAWTTIIVGLVEVVAEVAPVLVIFSHSSRVNGWDAGLVIAIAGVAEVMTSLLATFIAPNQSKMTDYIRGGQLDLILIRPVASQPFAALRWVQPAEAWGVLTGTALTIIGLSASEVPVRPELIIAAVPGFLLGLVAVALVWTNLGYLAFWLTSVAALGELFSALLTAGKYPLAFFPRAVRVIMLSLLPLGLATTIPVQLLTGGVRPRLLLYGVGLVVLLAIITRVHWLAGMRRYSSASS